MRAVGYAGLSPLLGALLGLVAASPARAQLFGTSLGTSTLHGAAPFGNPIDDSRLYVHGYFDQLEGRFGQGSYLRWDGQAWIGNDYNKLWLKSEGRYNVDRKGQTSDGDQELLYDRPITTFFDVQAGVRVDLDNLPARTWAALGVQGLAIGFWNVEATAYASDGGHYALRTNASYDLYLTQRVVLQPQFETNWYTTEDRGRQVGAGLSDIDMGLRLRYDITRKLAPYIGVAYQRYFGGTEGLVREQGGRINDVRFVAGLRTWF
ncbi:copper resistance protein B [Lichenicoccus sp.]|uniref:copper resistance protein B n=1 Tax=Lichenicoccus sp. TaxID=2781899 RepID=UPI003D09E666